MAYYVRANNEMYTDVGNFVSQAGVDVKRIDDAIKVILEVFATIKEKKVSEKDLLAQFDEPVRSAPAPRGVQR